ncbi:hypothetical protein SAMN05421788_101334 [Filimonas lacunae]|uniref:Uncharacterized protein n=1 Tax=Filimonas lacunae TaxID=477680 RepID=A0A173MMM4_9BACT|nr:hypothetical protein [Filimonas lacunae]BAV08884.1 hypothetical protein FLA_4931 [Filimonas lacunae]SIS63317.1 hypothetical protein SAMN05421788_101334 [Filimonas lacunae]
MNNPQQHLSALRDIRSMMEKSSRFVSLSGWSGVAAGICALLGAYLSHGYVYGYKNLFIHEMSASRYDSGISLLEVLMNTWLFWIAAGTFAAAFISSFIFTFIKSKKDGTPLWGKMTKRLLINFSIPLFAGGLFIYKLLHFGTFGLVAPGCLLFYGLALLNASKYTLAEIKYLGYGQLVLGVINLGFEGAGLYFWALGFGVLHIIYGIVMWYKYERDVKNSEA